MFENRLIGNTNMRYYQRDIPAMVVYTKLASPSEFKIDTEYSFTSSEEVSGILKGVEANTVAT